MKDIISIIEAMLEMGLIDKNRLTDVDYVAERVDLYIKAKNFVDTNFKNCFYNTNASKIKNVYIPYKYSNGVNTKTYNSAFNTTYGINGKNGVTVYDINTYTG